MSTEVKQELEIRYNPDAIESKWYDKWEKANLFKPSSNNTKKQYTVTIPPPNVTGALHMGHSLCYPIQDAVGRFKRLKGYNVWMIPGQDHAGIATQSLVEKKLKKEGISKHDLGREKFLEKVWEWRHESGDTIIRQFRQLGCAFDWDALRFTLDEKYVKAVLQVFIEWFEKGYIYKGNRIINWDSKLQTSVSDIETERKLVNGKLYYVRYKFEDGSGEITIATTRPETIPADVAVAVNPKDERYKGLIGKMLVLPLTGKKIPLIADEYPDPEFGTGALKITPAHDINDYEVGQRHNLDMPSTIDKDAKINDLYPPCKGMDRFEARKVIAEHLEEEGSLIKVEDHEIALIISERSGEPVEPLLSDQWFVKQTELAKDAIDVVKRGEIKFIPARYEKVYIDWMENIRDWCISRQLWWGHRIPVYYTESGNAFAAQSWEEAEAKAGSDKITHQDEDVLDTWFSSGLWPFAAMGWPDDYSNLDERYPTNLLVTDRTIIYLWVARMIMMGMNFMNKKPFDEVFVHATVLTEDGRRMSKSLGTGIDPITVIERMGVDPLRYTLLGATGENQEIRYSDKKNEESRNFCSKIWSASRFIFMNIDESPTKPENKALKEIDRWILSRLYSTTGIAEKAYEKCNFMEACNALQNFFWYDLCDWYIEISKNRFQDADDKNVVSWVLLQCLEKFLIMMHPILPHLTEEIYSYLPIKEKAEFVMSAEWPVLDNAWNNPEIENRVSDWFQVIRAVRALRADIGISPVKRIPELYIQNNVLDIPAEIIQGMAWIEKVSGGRPESVKFLSGVSSNVEFHIPIDDSIDINAEIERTKKNIEKISKEADKLSARLQNENYTSKAKPELVEADREKHKELEFSLDKLQQKLKLLVE